MRGLDSVPLPASGKDGKPLVHENPAAAVITTINKKRRRSMLTVPTLEKKRIRLTGW